MAKAQMLVSAGYNRFVVFYFIVLFIFYFLSAIVFDRCILLFPGVAPQVFMLMFFVLCFFFTIVFTAFYGDLLEFLVNHNYISHGMQLQPQMYLQHNYVPSGINIHSQYNFTPHANVNLVKPTGHEILSCVFIAMFMALYLSNTF